MQVQDVMSTPAVCCSIDATLDVAARLMWEADCGAIPVVDRDGRLAGILTDRDICMACYTQGKRPSDIGVVSVMAQDVVTSRPDDSLEMLERVLGQHQVRRVPVVDETKRPIGVISMNNLARHAASVNDGMDHALVATMAAICEPRRLYSAVAE
ncbi:MAG TPA: CBS domain-containing protein [Polyangiaceae bacterium]